MIYSCDLWPVRVAHEWMLADIGNDSIRLILHLRRRHRVPSTGLRRHLRLSSFQAQLVERMLHWFGHALRRPDSELINDLLPPIQPADWKPDEGVGNHGKARPGAPLRTVSVRLCTIEKGQGENL